MDAGDDVLAVRQRLCDDIVALNLKLTQTLEPASRLPLIEALKVKKEELADANERLRSEVATTQLQLAPGSPGTVSVMSPPLPDIGDSPLDSALSPPFKLALHAVSPDRDQPNSRIQQNRSDRLQAKVELLQSMVQAFECERWTDIPDDPAEMATAQAEQGTSLTNLSSVSDFLLQLHQAQTVNLDHINDEFEQMREMHEMREQEKVSLKAQVTTLISSQRNLTEKIDESHVRESALLAQREALEKRLQTATAQNAVHISTANDELANEQLRAAAGEIERLRTQVRDLRSELRESAAAAFVPSADSGAEDNEVTALALSQVASLQQHVERLQAQRSVEQGIIRRRNRVMASSVSEAGRHLSNCNDSCFGLSKRVSSQVSVISTLHEDMVSIRRSVVLQQQQHEDEMADAVEKHADQQSQISRLQYARDHLEEQTIMSRAHVSEAEGLHVSSQRREAQAVSDHEHQRQMWQQQMSDREAMFKRELASAVGAEKAAMLEVSQALKVEKEKREKAQDTVVLSRRDNDRTITRMRDQMKTMQDVVTKSDDKNVQLRRELDIMSSESSELTAQVQQMTSALDALRSGDRAISARANSSSSVRGSRGVAGGLSPPQSQRAHSAASRRERPDSSRSRDMHHANQHHPTSGASDAHVKRLLKISKAQQDRLNVSESLCRLKDITIHQLQQQIVALCMPPINPAPSAPPSENNTRPLMEALASQVSSLQLAVDSKERELMGMRRMVCFMEEQVQHKEHGDTPSVGGTEGLSASANNAASAAFPTGGVENVDDPHRQQGREVEVLSLKTLLRQERTKVMGLDADNAGLNNRIARMESEAQLSRLGMSDEADTAGGMQSTDPERAAILTAPAPGLTASGPAPALGSTHTTFTAPPSAGSRNLAVDQAARLQRMHTRLHDEHGVICRHLSEQNELFDTLVQLQESLQDNVLQARRDAALFASIRLQSQSILENLEDKLATAAEPQLSSVHVSDDGSEVAEKIQSFQDNVTGLQQRMQGLATQSVNGGESLDSTSQALTVLQSLLGSHTATIDGLRNLSETMKSQVDYSVAQTPRKPESHADLFVDMFDDVQDLDLSTAVASDRQLSPAAAKSLRAALDEARADVADAQTALRDEKAHSATLMQQLEQSHPTSPRLSLSAVTVDSAVNILGNTMDRDGELGLAMAADELGTNGAPFDQSYPDSVRMSEQLRQQQRMISKLKRQLAVVSEERDASMLDQSEKTKQLSSLEQRSSYWMSSEEAILDAERTHEELNMLVERLANDNQLLDTQLDKGRSQMQRTTDALQTAEMSNSALREQLADSEEANLQLSSQVETFEAETREDAREFFARLSAMGQVQEGLAKEIKDQSVSLRSLNILKSRLGSEAVRAAAVPPPPTPQKTDSALPLSALKDQLSRQQMQLDALGHSAGNVRQAAMEAHRRADDLGMDFKGMQMRLDENNKASLRAAVSHVGSEEAAACRNAAALDGERIKAEAQAHVDGLRQRADLELCALRQRGEEEIALLWQQASQDVDRLKTRALQQANEQAAAVKVQAEVDVEQMRTQARKDRSLLQTQASAEADALRAEADTKEEAVRYQAELDTAVLRQKAEDACAAMAEEEAMAKQAIEHERLALRSHAEEEASQLRQVAEQESSAIRATIAQELSLKKRIADAEVKILMSNSEADVVALKNKASEEAFLIRQQGEVDAAELVRKAEADSLETRQCAQKEAMARIHRDHELAMSTSEQHAHIMAAKEAEGAVLRQQIVQLEQSCLKQQHQHELSTVKRSDSENGTLRDRLSKLEQDAVLRRAERDNLIHMHRRMLTRMTHAATDCCQAVAENKSDLSKLQTLSNALALTSHGAHIRHEKAQETHLICLNQHASEWKQAQAEIAAFKNTNEGREAELLSNRVQREAAASETAARDAQIRNLSQVLEKHVDSHVSSQTHQTQLVVAVQWMNFHSTTGLSKSLTAVSALGLLGVQARDVTTALSVTKVRMDHAVAQQQTRMKELCSSFQSLHHMQQCTADTLTMESTAKAQDAITRCHNIVQSFSALVSGSLAKRSVQVQASIASADQQSVSIKGVLLQLDCLKERHTETNEAIALATTQLQLLKQDVQTLTSAASESDRTIQSFSTEKRELEAKIACTLHEVESSKKKLESQAKMLSKTDDELGSASTEIQRVKMALHKGASDYTLKMEQHSSEVAVLKAEYITRDTAQQAALQAAREEIGVARQMVTDLQQHYQESKTDCVSARAATEEIRLAMQNANLESHSKLESARLASQRAELEAISLQRHVDTLTRVSGLSAEKLQADSLEQVQLELQHAELSLAAKDEYATRMEADLQQQGEEIAQMRLQLTEKDSVHKHTIDSVCLKRDSLESEVKAVRQELKFKADTLEMLHAQHTAERDGNLQKLQAQQKELFESQSQHVSITHDLQVAKFDTDVVQRMLAQKTEGLEKLHKESQATISGYSAKIDDLQRSNAAASNKASESASEAGRLQGELSALNTEFVHTQRMLESRSSQSIDLQQQLQQKIGELKTDCESKGSQLLRLTMDLESSQSEVVVKLATIESLKAELVKTQQDAVAAANSAASAKVAMALASSEAKECRGALALSQRNLVAHTRDSEAAQFDLEKSRSGHMKSQLEQQNSSNHLKSRLAAQSAELGQLRKSSGEREQILLAQLVKCKKQMSVRCKEIALFRKTLAENDVLFASVVSDICDLKDQARRSAENSSSTTGAAVDLIRQCSTLLRQQQGLIVRQEQGLADRDLLLHGLQQEVDDYPQVRMRMREAEAQARNLSIANETLRSRLAECVIRCRSQMSGGSLATASRVLPLLIQQCQQQGQAVAVLQNSVLVLTRKLAHGRHAIDHMSKCGESLVAGASNLTRQLATERERTESYKQSLVSVNGSKMSLQAQIIEQNLQSSLKHHEGGPSTAHFFSQQHSQGERSTHSSINPGPAVHTHPTASPVTNTSSLPAGYPSSMKSLTSKLDSDVSDTSDLTSRIKALTVLGEYRAPPPSHSPAAAWAEDDVPRNLFSGSDDDWKQMSHQLNAHSDAMGSLAGMTFDVTNAVGALPTRHDGGDPAASGGASYVQYLEKQCESQMTDLTHLVDTLGNQERANATLTTKVEHLSKALQVRDRGLSPPTATDPAFPESIDHLSRIVAEQKSHIQQLMESRTYLKNLLDASNSTMQNLTVHSAQLNDVVQIKGGGKWEALLSSERRRVAQLEQEKRQLISKAAESMSSIKGILSQRQELLAAFSSATVSTANGTPPS